MHRISIRATNCAAEDSDLSSEQRYRSTFLTINWHLQLNRAGLDRIPINRRGKNIPIYTYKADFKCFQARLAMQKKQV